MAQLLSEEDVKKALDIADFRNLSKEKVIEFVSQIPNMDKDLAMKIMEQYPVFAGSAREIVGFLKDVCEKALEKNETSEKEVMLGYRKVLDCLEKSLENNELSEKERQELTRLMIEVADKMSAKDAENKEFIKDIVNKFAVVSVIVVAFGAAVLGVGVRKK